MSGCLRARAFGCGAVFAGTAISPSWSTGALPLGWRTSRGSKPGPASLDASRHFPSRPSRITPCWLSMSISARMAERFVASKSMSSSANIAAARAARVFSPVGGKERLTRNRGGLIRKRGAAAVRPPYYAEIGRVDTVGKWPVRHPLPRNLMARDVHTGSSRHVSRAPRRARQLGPNRT